MGNGRLLLVQLYVWDDFYYAPLQFWLNLKTRYDPEVAEDRLHNRLDNEIHAHKVQTV